MAHEHAGKGSGKFVKIDSVISLLVNKGDTFLDIGCGPGDYLESASKIAKEVIGLDKHDDSIKSVTARGFKGIIADATKKIPLKDKSVDSILLSNVMHGFVSDKTSEKVLEEVSRVIKVNGSVGVVEFKKSSIIGPPKEIRLSKGDLSKIFTNKGFSMGNEESVGLFNYIIVFKKQK